MLRCSSGAAKHTEILSFIMDFSKPVCLEVAIIFDAALFATEYDCYWLFLMF